MKRLTLSEMVPEKENAGRRQEQHEGGGGWACSVAQVATVTAESSRTSWVLQLVKCAVYKVVSRFTLAS